MYKIKKYKVRKSSGRHSHLNYRIIFKNLLKACYSNDLFNFVCNQLKQLSLIERRVLTSFVDYNGLSPLHEASFRGNVRLVEFMIKVCGTNLENLAVLKVNNARAIRNITPLWAATAGGHLEVISILVDAGANIDTACNHGRTPVNLACTLQSLEVPLYLIRRGADINRPDNDGKTCLMYSVISLRLCTALIVYGADVNAQDSSLKTALHYAIESHSSDVIVLLLKCGADPRLRCQDGHDAFQIVAREGCMEVLPLIEVNINATLPLLDAFNFYELLAASCIDKFTHELDALLLWKFSTLLRDIYNCPPKEYVVIPYGIFEGIREWNTLNELQQITTCQMSIHTQALLVAIRVLGPNNLNVIHRIIKYGLRTTNSIGYHACIALWNWALELWLGMETIFDIGLCWIIDMLTTTMMKTYRDGLWERGNGVPRHVDVIRAYTLVADNIRDARDRLELTSADVKLEKLHAFEIVLHCLTRLIYLLVRTASTDEEKNNVVLKIHRLMAEDIRSPRTCNSLLHLCVTKSNVTCGLNYTGRTTLNQSPIIGIFSVFPDLEVVRILVSYDRRRAVHARNAWGCTPLHVASNPANYVQPVVETLLAAGAHLDAPNQFGTVPAEYLALVGYRPVHLFRYISLACLAARVCTTLPQSVFKGVPPEIRMLVDIHSAY